MTREDLRKHCEQMMKAIELAPNSGTYQASKMIIDLLNQTEWIPISERLPEKYGTYLVTVKEGYMTLGIWIGELEYWANVVAWMQSPEPYKGGE